MNGSQDFEQCFIVSLKLFGEVFDVAEKYINFVLTYTRYFFVYDIEEGFEHTQLWRKVEILAQELTQKKVLTYKEATSLLKKVNTSSKR